MTSELLKKSEALLKELDDFKHFLEEHNRADDVELRNFRNNVVAERKGLEEVLLCLFLLCIHVYLHEHSWPKWTIQRKLFTRFDLRICHSIQRFGPLLNYAKD